MEEFIHNIIAGVSWLEWLEPFVLLLATVLMVLVVGCAIADCSCLPHLR